MLFVFYMPTDGGAFEPRWEAAVSRFENKQSCTNECPALCLVFTYWHDTYRPFSQDICNQLLSVVPSTDPIIDNSLQACSIKPKLGIPSVFPNKDWYLNPSYRIKW